MSKGPRGPYKEGAIMIRLLASILLGIFLLPLGVGAASPVIYSHSKQDAFYKSPERRLELKDKKDFMVLKASDVNFREKPVNGKIYCELDRHTLVEVLDRGKEWHKVRVNDKVGYIYAAYLGKAVMEELTNEDFALGIAALNKETSEEEIIKALGKPKEKLRKKGRTYYEYDKLFLGLHKNRLVLVETQDQALITMRGLSVGDSSGRFLGQYGLPARLEEYNKLQVYIYSLEEGREYFKVAFNKEGRAVAIQLEQVE